MRVDYLLALILAVLLFGLGGIISPSAEAATFTVNDPADAVDVIPGDGLCAAASGNCTLRAAIMETNALPGTHTIMLPAGNYVLSLIGANEDNAASGDLDITNNLIIRGDGATLTSIDGNATDRVFHIIGPVGVELIGLTIGNGDPGPLGSGGGISNNGGTLFLTNCTVIANNAAQLDGGGVFNAANGTLIATGTTLEGNSALRNGGAVYNEGVFRSEGSIIFANLGLNGGGIYNAVGGSLTINQNTFDTNFSFGTGTAGGGALFNNGLLSAANSTFTQNSALGGGHGGALYHNEVAGSLTTLARLTNVTIGENTADGNGGGINNLNQNTAGLVLVNVTLNLNSAALGGGLFNAGQASLLNTIVANNTGGNCSGIITSLGNNLDSLNTCGFAEIGDIINSDPLLLALAANGGPTFTYALGTGSPAIDAGNANLPPFTDSLTTDQRLFPRDVNFDIGAYEFLAENNASADLVISKTFSPNQVVVGTNFSYTLTVTNIGPSQSTGLSISDILPAGMTLNSIWVSQGTCSGTTLVTCDLGTLNPTASTEATIILDVTLPFAAVGVISNTAIVFAGAEPDPNLDNNADTADINPVPIKLFLPLIFNASPLS